MAHIFLTIPIRWYFGQFLYLLKLEGSINSSLYFPEIIALFSWNKSPMRIRKPWQKVTDCISPFTNKVNSRIFSSRITQFPASLALFA